MREELQRARTLQQKIRAILLEEWDPIGVIEIPDARDEYDGYVPDIYAILISQKPINDVFDYLLWAEAEHMGLTVNRQRTQRISEQLFALTARPISKTD